MLNALCWKDERASCAVFLTLVLLTAAWSAVVIMPMYTFASYPLYLGIACVVPTSLKERLLNKSRLGIYTYNAVSRVPCQDEYAHRRIAEMQRIKERRKEDVK